MHCDYCPDNPVVTPLPHCVGCGFTDRPLVPDTSTCTACLDWAQGKRPEFDFEGAASLLAAVVERAVTDKASVAFKRHDQITPTHCDAEGCDIWTFVCATEFLDVVREHAEDHEGDTDAVLELVASVALDSRGYDIAA